MQKALGYLLGVVLIVAGAVSMISYLLRDAHQSYYHNDFLHGLIGIVAGILVLNKIEFIIAAIPFMLGVLVLISGCGKLQSVIDMKRMEYGNGVVMLIFALVNVALGILLMCNPFQWGVLLFRILGLGLVFSGVTDCVVTVYLAAKIKRYVQEMNAVDSTYTEITGSAEENADN